MNSTKGFLGLLIRIGGAIISGLLLSQISVGNIHDGCSCLPIYVLHVVICIIASITDYFDSKPDSKPGSKPIKIHPILKVFSCVIGFVLSLVSMNLGHLICAALIFIASLISVIVTIAIEKDY